MHLVGFTVEIYYDARPYERQTTQDIDGAVMAAAVISTQCVSLKRRAHAATSPTHLSSGLPYRRRFAAKQTRVLQLRGVFLEEFRQMDTQLVRWRVTCTKQTDELEETVLQKIALNIPHCPAVPQNTLSLFQAIYISAHDTECCRQVVRLPSII